MGRLGSVVVHTDSASSPSERAELTLSLCFSLTSWFILSGLRSTGKQMSQFLLKPRQHQIVTGLLFQELQEVLQLPSSLGKKQKTSSNLMRWPAGPERTEPGPTESYLVSNRIIFFTHWSKINGWKAGRRENSIKQRSSESFVNVLKLFHFTNTNFNGFNWYFMTEEQICAYFNSSYN